MNRKYPDRPFVGVGAVSVQDGKVLLVKRKFEPLAGQWSLPGGAVEVGETLEACLVREMLEETGLEVRVGPVIEVIDRITQDVVDAGGEQLLCNRRIASANDRDDRRRIVERTHLRGELGNREHDIAVTRREVLARSLELARSDDFMAALRDEHV